MEYLFIAGMALAVVGIVWLFIIAFSTHWKWGIGGLIFPPSLLLFILYHARRATPAVGVVLAGLVLAFSPAVYTRLVPVDLGPHDKIVNGERHLTITGWDRQDYSVIAQKADTVVLQMANADVTDATLEYLKPLKNLRELDISFSQVTDQGVSALSELTELQTLHLQSVPITDAGLKQILESHTKLTQINLTGTNVSPELIQEWMAADPLRMALF